MGGNMTEKEVIEARGNAVRQMLCFHEDKHMYVFWRNVYLHYHNKAMEAERLRFLTRNEKRGRISRHL